MGEVDTQGRGQLGGYSDNPGGRWQLLGPRWQREGDGKPSHSRSNLKAEPGFMDEQDVD